MNHLFDLFLALFSDKGVHFRMSLQSLSTTRDRHRATPRPTTRPTRRGRRHEVVCAECDTLTTVPFHPTAGRPLYRRPCFQNHRRARPARANIREVESPSAIEISPEEAAEVATTFQGMALSAATRKAIAGMGIIGPTPIQEQAIPHLLAGLDLDRTSPYRFRKDTSVRRTHCGAMRSVSPAGTGLGAGTDP